MKQTIPHLLRAALIGVIGLTAASSASGEEGSPSPVVVELFTSQGCSSCPPADALMAELAGVDGVLPLSLHVDYWDYIGWADHFAKPEFTLRQKAYARAAGKRTIYTPQMVVQGHGEVVGIKPMKLAEMIRRHAARLQQMPISLTAARDGETVVIDLAATGQLPDQLMVQLVRFVPKETIEIKRGENEGKSVTYTNIVTDWGILGPWDGQSPLQVEVPYAGEDRGAVLIQRAGAGPILAATVVD